ncbi:hypothetical protein N7478_010183 [Penicillium angulare]|uniref:uncharacterized protein n=1 Tax=Penicillium angulare TaxID=116970 RepID=UPI0025414C10|nr:uncharacterized protein N7478_010183 [Penicillium angulare]KAJ5267375.1 hypothetical protein N7478_010183 [Penicillium angulare]
MDGYNWMVEDASQGPGRLFYDGVPFMAASTKAEVKRRIEVYEAHYGWLAILITSASSVFLLGLFSLYLIFATIIPNVFDPVVGLTYNKKYMPRASGLLDSEGVVLLGLPHVISTPTPLRAAYPSHSCLMEAGFLPP